MQKKERITNKIHYILLAVTVIIGFIIRFCSLGDKSLWVDEIYSYIFCSQKTFVNSFVFMFSDLSPPIYYLILYLWIKLFGNTEFVMRLPGFFAGIASIPVTYLLAKKFFNKQIALAATVLTGFAPVMLYYSQEARPYSLFALFSIITLFLWVEIINKIENQDDSLHKTLLSYTVSALISIFTHYWALIPVFFQILYVFIFSLAKKRDLKLLIVTAINIFYISGFYLFFQYSFMKKYAVILNPAFERVCTFNPAVEIFNQCFYNNYLFFLIIIIFLAINIKKVFGFATNEISVKQMASPLIYLVYIIVLPVCTYLIFDKASSFLHPRHLIFIITPLYTLISYIIFSFDKDKPLVKTGFVFCLSLAFLGIYLFVPQKIQNRYFTYYNRPKQEWKEATDYIIKAYDNKSLIILDRAEDFYNYYFKKSGKDIKKFNIVVDKEIFCKTKIKNKLTNYKKKYKKVYIFSTSMLKVENIRNTMKTAKFSCKNYKQKNYVNINLYECE